ncbi:hypothetical protein LXL04_037546 [Taraxacum kok-saghyz]
MSIFASFSISRIRYLQSLLSVISESESGLDSAWISKSSTLRRRSLRSLFSLSNSALLQVLIASLTDLSLFAKYLSALPSPSNLSQASKTTLSKSFRYSQDLKNLKGVGLKSRFKFQSDLKKLNIMEWTRHMIES